ASAALGLTPLPASDVVEVAGLGLSRTIDDVTERLGSAMFCGSDNDQLNAIWYRKGDAAPVALVMADDLREDAQRVVSDLAAGGLGVELQSGDRSREVERVASAVGIATFGSGVLPAGKLDRLKQLAEHGHKTLMIGDGLNDAPALAGGHASLSPASAADISQTAADAIFQGSALSPVLETLAVARESRRMALQNFGIAIGYNLIFVPLAIMGVVTPLIAAVAMSSSSIAVTLNAMRLRTKRLRFGTWRSKP
ncbi:MAG: HAD-IC family P-type ATPase, partial [Hyphomicrobiaceae bacterium]